LAPPPVLIGSILSRDSSAPPDFFLLMDFSVCSLKISFVHSLKLANTSCGYTSKKPINHNSFFCENHSLFVQVSNVVFSYTILLQNHICVDCVPDI
jgi:hypothetical protein